MNLKKIFLILSFCIITNSMVAGTWFSGLWNYFKSDYNNITIVLAITGLYWILTNKVNSINKNTENKLQATTKFYTENLNTLGNKIEKSGKDAQEELNTKLISYIDDSAKKIQENIIKSQGSLDNQISTIQPTEIANFGYNSEKIIEVCEKIKSKNETKNTILIYENEEIEIKAKEIALAVCEQFNVPYQIVSALNGPIIIQHQLNELRNSLMPIGKKDRSIKKILIIENIDSLIAQEKQRNNQNQVDDTMMQTKTSISNTNLLFDGFNYTKILENEISSLIQNKNLLIIGLTNDKKTLLDNSFKYKLNDPTKDLQ